MELRPYQREAIDDTVEAFEKHRSALMVMPTGTGKTVTFAHLIKEMDCPALIIAHREELIWQAANVVGTITGRKAEIDMANWRAKPNANPFFGHDLVVGTV